MEKISTPTAQHMIIPMDKIHEIPGVFTPKPPDRSLRGLVASIQIGCVKELVIQRQREDGEYLLLSDYRRHTANELAKKNNISKPIPNGSPKTETAEPVGNRRTAPP